jgi:hypothetical protein
VALSALPIVVFFALLLIVAFLAAWKKETIGRAEKATAEVLKKP